MSSTHNAKVQQIIEMGFERTKAEESLSRSNDDIEQAMTYLFDPPVEDDVPELLSSDQQEYLPGRIRHDHDANMIRASDTELGIASDASAMSIVPNNDYTTYANPAGTRTSNALVFLANLCVPANTYMQKTHQTRSSSTITCKLTAVMCFKSRPSRAASLPDSCNFCSAANTCAGRFRSARGTTSHVGHRYYRCASLECTRALCICKCPTYFLKNLETEVRSRVKCRM